MPFGSFQVSDEQALENAIRFVKEGGADAVKLEGAGPTLSRVRAIVGAGIPVMGHIGLTPQSATMLGGFKAQGRTAEQARRLVDGRARARGRRLLRDRARGGPGGGRRARSPRRSRSRRSGSAPAAACDGQVLVWHDLLGLYEGRSPRFVKRYADARPPRSSARSRPTPTEVRTRRASRRSSTRTRCPRRSWRVLRGALSTVAERRCADGRPHGEERWAGSPPPRRRSCSSSRQRCSSSQRWPAVPRRARERARTTTRRAAPSRDRRPRRQTTEHDERERPPSRARAEAPTGDGRGRRRRLRRGRLRRLPASSRSELERHGRPVARRAST